MIDGEPRTDSFMTDLCSFVFKRFTCLQPTCFLFRLSGLQNGMCSYYSQQHFPDVICRIMSGYTFVFTFTTKKPLHHIHKRLRELVVSRKKYFSDVGAAENAAAAA